MSRAGIFIGVDKTGTLPRLNDAATGAKRMHQWALSQGMADETHAKLITDANGKKVGPDMIYDAIKEIIDGPGVDQLILYFAGHGVNSNRAEQWLLTDAPERASAAVNVSGSVELARYCGIQHVVVISDACRVAPDGIQGQRVSGVDVFPNEGGGSKAKPVDQFFACYLGKTAAELRDPVITSKYSALYTDALLDALRGDRAEVLEPAPPGEDNVYYIRPVRLENYLENEVPLRVRAAIQALNLKCELNQNPDAIIIASPSTWVARLDKPAMSAGPRAGPPAANARATVRNAARKLVRSAVLGDRAKLHLELERAKIEPIVEVRQLAQTAERIVIPFGPDHFETECGIKVRGRRIVEFFAPRAQAELLGSGGDLLRVNKPEAPAASVLLRFEGNVGTVVPAIPGFIAGLTFEGGELVDVAYEPSANSPQWGLYKDQADELRALRAIAASSSDHGRFRLEQDDALEVAQKMQNAKWVDPAFAVYAAYAYHDLQAIDRIQEMSGYLRRDFGLTLFDLALLSRALINKPIAPNDGIVPFVPLLSQGWALLRAHRVQLHPTLAGIESTLRASLWSLFDVGGVEKLKQAMASREVR